MATVQVSFYTKTKGWKRDLIEIVSGTPYEVFVSKTIPNKDRIQSLITQFDNTNNISEEAIRHLIDNPFKETKDSPIYTYTKVSLINDNYSTHLSSAEKSAISKILYDFSEDIQKRNYNRDLIDNIRSECRKPNMLNKDPYSFITKYCCHHNPDNYPIFDSYVEIMLKWFSDLEDVPFHTTDKNSDFCNYDFFRNVLMQFKEYCETNRIIESISYRNLDKYLWSAGKEFFNPYINKKDYEKYKNNPNLY